MQDLKKYFEFSGTISGSNYLLRNLIAGVAAFIGGFLIGYGIVQSTGLIMLGLLILAPACWLSIANIYKRFNALYPRSANEYTIGLIFLQVLNGFVKGQLWGNLISLVLIVISCVLIFRNSNIDNHEG
jgi:hypothetical protein